MTSATTPQYTLTTSQSERVIYFAGSIRAGRGDVGIYADLIQHLSGYGQVITEHVGDYSLSISGQCHLSDRFIHDRDLRWLRSSDFVVAEVTNPSLGVGYEIATAISWRIPVIALYRGGKGALSAMISGSPDIETHVYANLDEARRIIDARLGQKVDGVAAR